MPVICRPVRPPALASLIPPVNGDLPPTEILSVDESICPTNRPGAKINLFPPPSGSHFASTSSSRMRAKSPRPPSRFHESGMDSWVRVCERTFTRQTWDLYSGIVHPIRKEKIQLLEKPSY